MKCLIEKKTQLNNEKQKLHPQTKKNATTMNKLHIDSKHIRNFLF